MLVEGIVVLVVIFCLSYSWLFGFWDRRNVFNVKFEFTRQMLNKIIKNQHSQDRFEDLYRKYKSEGLVGFYTLFSPMLLVTDPELVKTVIVKDFNKFHDTAMEAKEEVDPLFAPNPFFTKGMEKWKELRSIQASNMTAVRFKEIIPIMYKVAQNMVNYLTEKKIEPVVAKEFCFLYTVDNSCSCGFGIEPSAFTDPENNFVKYANSENIFKPSPFTMFCRFSFPKVANFLKLRVLSEEAEEFFKSFVQKMIEYRSSSNVSKNDFINYLIKLNRKLKEENKQAYTNLELAAHCLTFYVDSTETSSNQLAFFLLDLANHQHVQDKLRKEISSISKCPTDFDLDKVSSINYLNMAFNESLRIHNQTGMLSRTCTEDTVIRNTPIPKGTRVFIPVGQFHMDPEYFPNPEKFEPERFSEEKKDSIPKYSFLPFGEGPRICVGYKYASLQIRLAVIFLLLNFTILPSNDDGKEEIILDNAPVLTPGPRSKLKFKPIDVY
ncbi:cytochrome P450 6j1 isoform X1 [Halyomorpha halys]|uniref:cytochrome P450 6j1 isoform X1 n=1 Tax=Halyomorpha halys TaxID=286706 RepID=UPI0006D4DEE8|nr:cytochrome P450 6j1-like isoform X1 [Halyomorpha halys]XP_014287736.1 cytochrome P450 6j1-like isoform X1 [Halyomorpha halys]XP_014287737.1 cytochrome P450 6j1-like isoform X1 [Halyomorpha halys]